MRRGLLRLLVRLLQALGALVALALAWAGVFTLAALRTSYPVVPAREGPRWVRGAYHVHTDASHDGRGSEAEVARAAREAGLDFVVVTDHNRLPPPSARRVDGVLLVPGVELSTPHGHLVAFGLQGPLEPQAARGERPVDAVRAAGGTAVLAHPVQRKNPWRDDAQAERAAGLELYSLDTLWREAAASPVSRGLPAIGAYLGRAAHGLMLLAVPQPDATRRLLELGEARGPAAPPPLALCAHDAHGLPSYVEPFRALALYLPGVERLPEDAGAAAREVSAALAGGRALCAFRALGEPEGFALEPLGADGAPARAPRAGGRLRVALPAAPPGVVQLRAWGAGRVAADGRHVDLTGPGLVQVEAWVRAPGRLTGEVWRPWVVPGPLRVAPASAPGVPPTGGF